MWALLDEWSRSSPRYNRAQNEHDRNYIHGVIDINYLVYDLNLLGNRIEYIPACKEILGITTTDARLQIRYTTNL